MSNSSPRPRTYSELYARWRDYVATELEEAPEHYVEDDYMYQLVTEDVRSRVVPEGTDYPWANGIVMSRPEMLREKLPAGGSTLLAFTLDTIRCKVVRDLLNEFEPTFERLREAHRTGEIGSP